MNEVGSNYTFYSESTDRQNLFRIWLSKKRLLCWSWTNIHKQRFEWDYYETSVLGKEKGGKTRVVFCFRFSVRSLNFDVMHSRKVSLAFNSNSSFNELNGFSDRTPLSPSPVHQCSFLSHHHHHHHLLLNLLTFFHLILKRERWVEDLLRCGAICI